MKKIILAALFLKLICAPAFAESFDVSLSVYYNSVFYNIDSDTNLALVDNQFKEDAEIAVKAETKEGDYIYGLEIQVEASEAADQIDEHYIYVKGPWGKIEVGAENSAAYKAQVHAPKFLGWKTYDNNFKTWSEVSAFVKPDHSHISKDANKLNYYSPRVHGFQAVFAFTPSNEQAGGSGAGNSTLLQQTSGQFETISLGLTYQGELAGGELKTSYTMEEGDDLNGIKTAQDSALGMSYKIGKFEIGGTAYQNEFSGGTKKEETEILHIGAAYKVTQDTTLGVAFHNQEDAADGVREEKTDIIILGGNTKLLKGVKLTYSFETVAFTQVDNVSKDSTFMGVGLLLKF